MSYTSELGRRLQETYDRYKAEDPSYETSLQSCLIEAVPFLLQELEKKQNHLKEKEEKLDKIILLLGCEPTVH